MNSCRLLGTMVLLIATALPARGQERFRVLEEPGTSAVGFAVVLNAGGAWELERESGLGQLAVRALLEDLRPRLDGLAAYAAVSCELAALQITLVAPPSTWDSAVRALLEALRSPRFSDAAFERARRSLLAQLAMQEAGPVYEARQALLQAFFGDNHRWATADCGRTETVAGLDPANARRLLTSRASAGRMTAAIVGPVDPREARSLLQNSLGSGSGPVLLPVPVPAPAARSLRLTDNSVNAWLELAFPIQSVRSGSSRGLPPLDREALAFIAHYLRDLTAPSAANSEVFDTFVELQRYGGGGALVASLVVARDQDRRWADQLRAAVQALQRNEMPQTTFDIMLRRYRGVRLLELAEPESRALEVARQLFFDGSYEPAAELIDRLTPAQIRSAAARLGNPAVAVLGPD